MRAGPVPSAEAMGHHALRAALTFTESGDPYSVVLPSLEVDDVVALRSEATLAAGYAYQHRWLVTGSLPLLVAQSGSSAHADSSLERPAEGAALGDASLSLRGLLLGSPRREFALSLDATLWAPTGSTAA